MFLHEARKSICMVYSNCWSFGTKQIVGICEPVFFSCNGSGMKIGVRYR